MSSPNNIFLTTLTNISVFIIIISSGNKRHIYLPILVFCEKRLIYYTNNGLPADLIINANKHCDATQSAYVHSVNVFFLFAFDVLISAI